jgi:exodeoxyribonuclease V gamma subunit
MLHIIQSNKLEHLAKLLATFLQQPKANPLMPTSILVQSPGMSTWLKIELAQQNGIAAGLSFPLLSSFAWQLYHTLLDQVPAHNNFTKDAMTWRLMEILPAKLTAPLSAYQPLRNYLNQDSFESPRFYQLCHKIADIFDQYLVFRGDWMRYWAQNQPHPQASIQATMDQQPWQADLWRALLAFDQEQHFHRADLHQQLLKTLHERDFNPTALPQQLFVFGVSTMPPQMLETLHGLASHIDIMLFHLNPCQHYWGDLVNEKYRAKAIALYGRDKALADNWQTSLTVGNPLLANHGKIGREFLDMLLELPDDDLDISIDAFEAHPSDQPLTLLHRIQNDILKLEMRHQQDLNDVTPFQSHEHKMVLQPSDQSLHLIRCHSAMRELEVLHDYLLKQRQQNPNLQLRDIVVMVPNVADYAPYIDAVFGSKTGHLKLPYAISDRGAKEANPLIQSFFKLLALHESRFSLPDVLSLLEVPAVLRRFQLDETDFDQLKQWLVDAGVRWGRDAAHRSEHDLPAFDHCSWRFGLQRLLLGYAFADDSDVYQGCAPLAHVEGQQAQAIGGLLLFIDTLDDIKQQRLQSCSADQHIRQLRQLLSNMYHIETEAEQAALAEINQSLEQLEDQWQRLPQSRPIAPVVIQAYFQEKLNDAKVGQHFLAGAINFCTLMPMRSIPFQIICLLGMNDGDYPRQQHPIGFDLMAHTPPRRGDRSRRFEDRYLFLEALLSARQQLYISYLGHSIQDNTDKMPSLVISELLEYCRQICRLPEHDVALPSDPQQAFEQIQIAMNDISDRLTTTAPLQPFDVRHYQAEHPLQSFTKQWLPLGQPVMAEAPLAPPSTLIADHVGELANLLRFYHNPIAYFYQRILNVNLLEQVQMLPDHEPFQLNSLEAYQIRADIIQATLKQEQTPVADWQAQGRLPQPPLADFCLDTIHQDCRWQREVIQEKIQTEATSQQIQLQVGDITLQGRLDHIYPDGLIQTHASQSKAHQLLLLGLRHLIRQASGHVDQSSCIDLKKIHTFSPIEPDAAKALLGVFIDYFAQGLEQPLPWCNFLWDYCLKAPESTFEDFCQAWERKLPELQQSNNHDQRDRYLLKILPHQRLPDIYKMQWTLCQNLIQPLQHYLQR